MTKTSYILSSSPMGSRPTLVVIEMLCTPSRTTRLSEDLLVPSGDGGRDLAATRPEEVLAARVMGEGCIEAALADEPASAEVRCNSRNWVFFVSLRNERAMSVLF
jgi:hypothetical protein